MRILYFHQHFSTPLGSTGIRSYEMAKRLVQKGHSVTMVCGSYAGGNSGLNEQPFIDSQRRGQVDGINIVEFELSYANNQSFTQRIVTFLRFAYRSVKVALTHDYDLVFATTTPLTVALPGIAARWFRKKTFIFEVRDLWPELPKAMGVITNPAVLFGMGVLEKLAYRTADGHIGLSPGIVEGIKKHLKPEQDVAMIPNGCDIQLFNQQPEAWQPDQVNDEDFVAVFSGTHGMANGLDSLIEVAKTLKNKNINHVKLVLIGQGKCKPELVEQASKYQLNNIVFLDPVDKRRLSGLFVRADIGMQVLANVPAFYYGTSPNKFFDYISAGLPVINNYPGWLAELIEEHQCGIVVPPEQPEAFADALIALSNSRESLAPMAENAKQLALTAFDREQLATRFVEYIEQVASDHD